MNGKELLKIRKSLGVTQEQMAEKIGVRGNTIARWERSESKISEPISRLIRLLSQMGTKSPSKPKRKDKKYGLHKEETR